MMLGEESAILNFDRVLNYAVRVSGRYQRNLSLVMLSSEEEGADVTAEFSPTCGAATKCWSFATARRC